MPGVYRWNGHSEADGSHSLLRYAEEHGERLRRVYLSWIHDLGESQVDGVRLVDRLALGDGLSFWWMTLLAEKNPWKSRCIADAIRLLALEEILVRDRPSKLLLVSPNRDLREAIARLCSDISVEFRWERVSPIRRRLDARRIYHAMPLLVQALSRLARRLTMARPLKDSGRPPWFGGDRSVFFCSYFDNVDPAEAADGHFHSYYWDQLPALLRRTARTSKRAGRNEKIA